MSTSSTDGIIPSNPAPAPGSGPDPAHPPRPPAIEPPATPAAPPGSLLGPGSQDDTFLQSPHRHRAAPGLFHAATRSDPGSTSDGLLDTIDTSTPLIPVVTGRPGPAAPGASSSRDGEGDEGAGSRTSWPVVLLASYSSAVTLALAWLWLHPRVRDPAPVPFASAEAAAAPAPPAASGGRRVEPVAALPDDRVARIGQMLRVGALEITPLEAKRQDVALRRVGVTGATVERKGLPGTIVLRVRLRNASDDQAFAPLDPAFVRQAGADVPPTFAEAPGGVRLYPYPLALESEMGIVGQDFRELRPGEARVFAIVTAPDAPPVNPATLFWRLRLRTAIDQTGDVGVNPATAPAAKPG